MAKNHISLGDTIGTWINKNNDLVNKVGDLALLQTSATADSCIVFAVNEVHADALLDSARLDSAETRLDGLLDSNHTKFMAADSTLDSDMGNRLSLQTIDKTDLVTAINEVNTLATYFATYQDSDLIIGKEQDTKIILADSSVTIEGNLVIKGTVYDNGRYTGDYLVINEGQTGASPSLNGGFAAERGDLTNARLTWNETTDRWTAGLAGTESKILLTSDIGTDIVSKADIDAITRVDSAAITTNITGTGLAHTDSNASLGTFVKRFEKHNRFVLGDSSVSGLHVPGINNFFATTTSTLNIYASDGVTVLKTLTGFS